MRRHMKKYILILWLGGLLMAGCEDYLEIPNDIAIDQNDVFGSYQSFQGFIDPLYQSVVDYNSHSIVVGHNLTGETLGSRGFNTSVEAANGNYRGLVYGRSNFFPFGDGAKGIYAFSWEGIRIANLAIANIDLMTDATQEQRDLILGQAYFFRAFFHWELGRAFGSIPYLDFVFEGGQSLDLPRFYEYEGKFDYQAMTEKMVEDFDRAAELLPLTWPVNNDGRATRGAAVGFKSKALLYAGSPLMNEFSRNTASFDEEYMRRAAEAAGEVLKLADQGVYSLTPFENYQDMFAKNDGTLPVTDEVIFRRVDNNVGAGQINTFLGRLYLPESGVFGGNPQCEAVTQNFVDEFEMADGTKYIPGPMSQGGYDDNNARRWNDRDPRFREAIYVDGDLAGLAERTRLQMYEGGRTIAEGNGGNTLSPYIVHKFWIRGANRFDREWNGFRYTTPHLRLAEIYLIYAEGVFEATGNANATATNYTMTAVQAVNAVRNRAGMPNTTATPAAYDGDFREQLRNERDVELCFEGHRWYDIRRWKERPYTELFKMVFDRNYTFFNRESLRPFIFEERNYWMPFPDNQVFLFESFPQNPGW